MNPKHILMLGGCLVWSLATPASADAEPSASADAEGQDTIVEEAGIGPEDGIVVSAQRLRGQLQVEQAPVLELNEQDILAIGATSVADLIAAIGPQTGSSRGRGGGQPVFLVNGIRIGSFREMRSYPPEAIAKVEVLPEEVAQRFGFPPDRRVVNMILKENYSSREIEFELEAPERGGYTRTEQQFTLLQIRDGGRLNLNLEANDVSLLTEAERDVIQTPGSVPDISGDPDPAQFRSLVPDSRQFEATANWAKAYFESGSSVSLNATYERDESRSLSGLNTVLLTAPGGASALRSFGEDDPLERRGASDTFSTAASWTRRLGGFQFTATLDASHALSTVEIDRRADTQPLVDAAAAGTLALDAPLADVADNGFDTARTRTWAGRGKLTASGAPLYLPAGELATTVDLGYEWDRIASNDTRSASDARLTRGDLEAGLNLVIPLTSRRDGVWDALGSFALNAQVGINHLSDFGTLKDWSGGLNWSPWDNLDLQATYVWREVAPTLGNLGNPRVETLNVPVFDFVNGESVLATVISGGNPDLVAETQRDWRFSATWELPFIDDTQLSAEYIRNRSRNVTGEFPALSAEIEAAFPERVIRDADGTLISLDRRPITYVNTRNERLVFGLTTRGTLGPQGGGERGARSGAPGGGPPPGAGRGGPGGGMPGFGGRGGGRYFVNLTHTFELDNRILIAQGGPLLDLLDGDSQGDFGQARHSSRLEAGIFLDGKAGLRVSGTYTGKARIDGDLVAGTSPLLFGDILRIDLRLFTDVGRLTGSETGLLKGVSLSLVADNVFDAQRRVRDADGNTPLRYQRFLLDPTGRYFGIDLRKMF